MTIRFDDQVVIVTGAGGGLGRCHALEFARRGAKLVINDIGGAVDGTGKSGDAAQRVVEEIEAGGGVAIPDGASVSDEGGVADLVKKTLDRFGRIDVLVNNAGILRDKTFANMTLEDFGTVMEVHLSGTVNVCKAVWPAMREQSYGRIIVTTSSSGLYGNFGQSNYGAAKLAVVGLINTLKLEGQKYNIHCNAVAPVALTRMTQGLLPSEAEQLMQPAKVTPAVMFLAGASAPNGVILCAGGGVYAKTEIVESKGTFLGPDAQPEDIERHWDEIADMTEAQAFTSGGEQTVKFFEMAAKR